MNLTDLETKQKEICQKYGAAFQKCDMNLKVGISPNIKTGERPIHGIRIAEENGTTGWYIWAGEWSDDPNFFVPLHAIHLRSWAEVVLPFLGLPEGWRFIVDDNGYEDVWFSPAED